MSYRILIIETEPQFASALKTALKDDFDVESCQLARQALEKLHERPPDILLIDSDMPDMEGLAFLRAIRESEPGKEIPVILMSRTKTEQSVLEAFNLGIDDYLVKPFDPREMLVRVRVVLRRKYERLEHAGRVLSIGGVEIDPSQRRCLVHGERVRLQPREFELLEILMRKAGRVLTRVYLLETVWGMSSTAETRAVDVMVSRVRKRLGRRAARMIETVSKMGYCFRDPEAP